MGLGATLTTFNPSTTIKSADVNTDLANLNGATDPTFNSVTLNEPPILASGNQETGQCGVSFSNGVTSHSEGAMTPFKTVMTHTPSSITLNVIPTPNNVGSVAASVISIYAFRLDANLSANGGGSWSGNYTTVGNCLLAVDAEAGTFDHHCDVCRAIALDAPFTDLDLRPVADLPTPLPRGAFSRDGWEPGSSGLSYRCRRCGAVEAFATSLTEADAANPARMRIPGSSYRVTEGEHASRVRALLRALDLPVIEGDKLPTWLAWQVRRQRALWMEAAARRAAAQVGAGVTAVRA